MPPYSVVDALGMIAVVAAFMVAIAIALLLVRFVARGFARSSPRVATWQVVSAVLLVALVFVSLQYLNVRTRLRQEEAMVALREWGYVLTEMRQAHACAEPPSRRRGPCPDLAQTPTSAPFLAAVREISLAQLPLYDPWGNAFVVSARAPLLLIQSAGGDGEFGDTLRRGPILERGASADLVWENGELVRYTEGTSLPDPAKYRKRWSSSSAGVADVKACADCHRLSKRG